MNIYRISQNKVDYAIVAAKSEENARCMHPEYPGCIGLFSGRMVAMLSKIDVELISTQALVPEGFFVRIVDIDRTECVCERC